jgi:hypothetical protein
MSVVSALRTLWRLRVVTALVAVFALLAGVSMAYRIHPPASFESRGYQVGLGSAQALVDTPSSQVVDLGGTDQTVDIATLSARASLLASLMTSSPLREEIAKRAGVSPDDLIAVPPASADASAGGPSPGTTARMASPKAIIVKTTIPELQSGQIPIIHVQTQAPEPETASRLANSAVEVLQKHLTDVATNDDVPGQRRIVIRQLGPASATIESRGPSKGVAVFAALFVFAAGCGLILGLSSLLAAWRKTNEIDDYPDETLIELGLLREAGDRPDEHDLEETRRYPDTAKL